VLLEWAPLTSTLGLMIELDGLIERWKSQGVGLSPPASIAEVHAAFQAIGAVPTPDVIALYHTCGGMNVMDDELWRLWSLAEVVEANRQPSDYGFLFGDYLMDSWCYRFRMSDDGTSAAVYVDYFNDAKPTLVAKTLAEFFSKLLHQPFQLLEQFD